MRYVIFHGKMCLSWVIGLALSVQTISAQSILRGVVTDGKTNLEYASIRVLSGDQLITSSLADSLGRYQLTVPQGVYRLVVYWPGFPKAYSARIELVDGQTTIHHVLMTTPRTFDEAEIVDFKVPLRDQIMSGKGLIDFSEPTKKPDASTQKKKN